MEQADTNRGINIKMQYTHINKEHIFELGDNDEEFIKDIIDDIISSVPDSLEKITTAAENESKEDIIFVAHKLKGTFRFAGINELGDIMERIEKTDLPYDDIRSLISDVTKSYAEAESELQHLSGEL